LTPKELLNFLIDMNLMERSLVPNSNKLPTKEMLKLIDKLPTKLKLSIMKPSKEPLLLVNKFQN